MNSRISGLIIEHPSGGEIEFDTESEVIQVILNDGSSATFKKRDTGDLFSDSRVAYHRFERFCIVVGETGADVLAIWFDQPLVEPVCEIKRTELMDEGFDYCLFYEVQDRVVLCYEHGLIAFDLEGRIVWQQEFSGARVQPQIVDGEILFAENERDWWYAISDGKMRPGAER